VLDGHPVESRPPLVRRPGAPARAW